VATDDEHVHVASSSRSQSDDHREVRRNRPFMIAASRFRAFGLFRLTSWFKKWQIF
jgi:hypothetical protein